LQDLNFQSFLSLTFRFDKAQLFLQQYTSSYIASIKVENHDLI